MLIEIFEIVGLVCLGIVTGLGVIIFLERRKEK